MNITPGMIATIERVADSMRHHHLEADRVTSVDGVGQIWFDYGKVGTRAARLAVGEDQCVVASFKSGDSDPWVAELDSDPDSVDRAVFAISGFLGSGYLTLDRCRSNFPSPWPPPAKAHL